MGFLGHLFGDKEEGKVKYVYIRGMMCDNCTKHVAQAIKEVPGVLKVNVSLMDKLATLHVTDDLDETALFDAIVKAGYGVDKITDHKE